VLQPIAPSPYPGPALADEAEGVGEPGRAGPPVLVGCDELVSAVAEGEEVEPEILAAGVDEPELGHAGLGVEKGEALGIPLLGRVAQDLYDQVRSPLDAVEAVWTPSRKEPHPFLFQGIQQDDGQVGLDGEFGLGGDDPGASAEDIAEILLLPKPACPYRRKLNARKNSSATSEGLPTSAPAPSSGSQSAGR